MDGGGIEQVGVDVGVSAVEKTAAADGKDLAHTIGSVIDTVGIGPGGPNGVALDDFDDDAIVGQGEQMVAIGFAAQALLPNAPEHPLMTEGREVGAYLLGILGFLEATCCITAFGGEQVALYCQGIVTVPAPLAAEVEELDAFPLIAEAGEGEAYGLIAEVQLDAVARVVGTGVGEQTEVARVEG